MNDKEGELIANGNGDPIPSMSWLYSDLGVRWRTWPELGTGVFASELFTLLLLALCDLVVRCGDEYDSSGKINNISTRVFLDDGAK